MIEEVLIIIVAGIVMLLGYLGAYVSILRRAKSEDATISEEEKTNARKQLLIMRPLFLILILIDLVLFSALILYYVLV